MRGDKEIPAIVGIYGIYCSTTNGVYVGSSVNMRVRTKQHRTDLKCGKHRNKLLQSVYDTYGVDVFELRVLEVVVGGRDKLITAEQTWIDRSLIEYSAIYNERLLASGNYGHTHTQEAREKIRQNSKYFMSLPENKRKYSEIMKERMQDPEFREKVSCAKEWGTVYDPSGNAHVIGRDLKRFCAEHDIAYQGMKMLMNGKQPHAAGWRLDPTFDWLTNHASAITYNVRLCSPDGTIYGPVTNSKRFAETHNLDPSCFLKLLQGQQKTHRGWKFIDFYEKKEV